MDDADPIDLPGGVFLDDLDVEALTSQGNGRGQAADATADYKNLCGFQRFPLERWV
jgi:hypothetical protein